MNALPQRLPATVIIAGLFSLLTASCVVPGGGFGYGPSTGFGLGYYEPTGVNYGGWGGGYYVGPVHGGPVYGYHGGGGAQPHAFRAAPASRPVPSIPSHARGGGSPSRGSGPRAPGSR